MYVDAKDFDLLSNESEFDYVLKKPRAEVISAADLLPKVLDSIEDHEPPTRWRVDDVPWGRYWFEPSKLLVVGGPTGGAKTALMMDTAFRALARNPSIRVVVANVEDTVEDLLLRGIASHTRTPIDQLRNREGDQLTPERMALIRQALEAIGPRLHLVRRPFTVERVIAAASAFEAEMVMFDYLQELRLEDRDGDAQDNVRRIMPQLRALADRGACVVVTAALSREGMKHIRARSGANDYHELDSAIFRDASQIEHAMDEGFCLIPDRGAAVVAVPGQAYSPIPTELYHVKTRAGQRVHVPLVFDGRYQRFALREQGAKKKSIALARNSAQPQGHSSPKASPKTNSQGGTNGHWLGSST
jgi:replicative DNA helicase